MFEKIVLATDLSADWDQITRCIEELRALGCPFGGAGCGARWKPRKEASFWRTRARENRMMPYRPAVFQGGGEPAIMSSSPTKKDRFPLVAQQCTGMPLHG
jgi:hypothetical protein